MHSFVPIWLVTWHIGPNITVPRAIEEKQVVDRNPCLGCSNEIDAIDKTLQDYVVVRKCKII